jgi:hypothetical protein
MHAWRSALFRDSVRTSRQPEKVLMNAFVPKRHGAHEHSPAACFCLSLPGEMRPVLPGGDRLFRWNWAQATECQGIR